MSISIEFLKWNMQIYKNVWVTSKSLQLTIENNLLCKSEYLGLYGLTDTAVRLYNKKTRFEISPKIQNDVLRNQVNTLWYIRNDNFLRDLLMEYASVLVLAYEDQHRDRISTQVNSEQLGLLEEVSVTLRRMKRIEPHDLASRRTLKVRR